MSKGHSHRRIYGKCIETGAVWKFNSVSEAAKVGGFDRTSIQLCLSGKTRQHKGYVWHYVSDF